MRRSSEATGLMSAMAAPREIFALKLFLLCCAAGLLVFMPTWAISQTAPAVPAATQSEEKHSSETSSDNKPPDDKQNSAELVSHDEPATFKVNVKLVVVRAVVRDSKGHAVGNLQKDDFQIFDKGKPQVISQFEVEQPGSATAKARKEAKEAVSADPSADEYAAAANAPLAPDRFVAYLFDDVHLSFGDLVRVREAAERDFAKLQPTDRVAVFTTSGQNVLDFTDDRVKLHEALLHLQPRPISGDIVHDCPDIGYYQADQIVNKNDLQATSVAIQEYIACAPPQPNNAPPPNASAMVFAVSASVLSKAGHESQIALNVLKNVVNDVSRMPGRRSVVLVSPGFMAPDLIYEYNDIIDRAVRAQVAINTLDARGLYTVVPFGDISQHPTHAPPPGKGLIDLAAAAAQDELLATLADGTGGVFFHNNNDFDEGFRRAAEAPEYSYVLAFAPQNLRLDGSFHSLKVTVKNLPKLTLQARRGYYAPKHLADANEEAKQEIEDEMYSQEELYNLPVKLRTQFFKAGDDDAKLVVLAHVDVQHLRFRKSGGRNNNVLTCLSAVFNRNGNFMQGSEKIVTMHWKDETLQNKLASGITLKTSFDVKPGSYMVRLVVRDAEGRSMSAENGTVEIR